MTVINDYILIAVGGFIAFSVLSSAFALAAIVKSQNDLKAYEDELHKLRKLITDYHKPTHAHLNVPNPNVHYNPDAYRE